MSIQEGDSGLDQDGIPELETIMNVSGGLLKYEKETGTIRFVHATLEGFLQAMKEELFPQSQYYMARRLRTYLNFETFSKDEAASRFSSTFGMMELRPIQRSHKFFRYAFENWSSHVDRAGAQGIAIASEITLRIAESHLLLGFVVENRFLDLPFSDLEGLSDVHIAAAWGLTKCLEARLQQVPESERSAIVNQRSTAGLTPLHLAASRNYVETAKILVQYGADIAATDRQNRTPFYISAGHSQSDLLKFLVESCHPQVHALLKVKNTGSLTPLHAALECGSVQCAQILLRAGARPEQTTSSGMTCLHYAVQYASAMTSSLLAHGACTKTESKNGRTALHWACVTGDRACISILLQYGFDATVSDDFIQTPLHLLAKAVNDQVECASMLLCHGTNVNAGDKKGMTPLHHAILAKNFKVALVLLEAGAEAGKHHRPQFCSRAPRCRSSEQIIGTTRLHLLTSPQETSNVGSRKIGYILDTALGVENKPPPTSMNEECEQGGLASFRGGISSTSPAQTNHRLLETQFELIRGVDSVTAIIISLMAYSIRSRVKG